MSSIKLKHSGGNSVSLNPPTSAPTSTEVAFKLPTSDGSAGQVLQTDGSGNLSWVTPATSNVAFSMLDLYHLGTDKSLSAGTWYYLNADFTRRTYGAIGTGLTKTNEVFSFPSTGIYMINFRSEVKIASSSSSRYRGNAIWTTTDNSNYTSRDNYGAVPPLNYATYNMMETTYVFDVVNTGLDKFKLAVQMEVDGTVRGSTDSVKTQLIVYKIAET